MSRSALKLTLVGGPTVLIEFGSIRLLTDPTFDPPGSYRINSLHFEKTTGPALSLAEIGAGALEAAHAFPKATIVAAHNEGWGHFRESQDQLADVFAQFHLPDRLVPFEKGRPLVIPVQG
mgnify:CR=1 FL=1